ncbi:MAG: adenosine 5-monophosphoramidase [Alphaproteobacteria bacterium]|jgi:diadenosine tetraphosphate (Ap4A) HIT family hydrolase|nr:adenosine 5-monophosphoramidase [Alphaproteobacteria bacterium]
MTTTAPYDKTNIFARILRGELPCKKVFENEFALAFEDIHPSAPVHVLVIPKGEFVSFDDFAAKASEVMQAGFWRAVGTVARQTGVDKTGYRIVANHGADAHQIVFHFHVHVIGGRQLSSKMANMPKELPQTA